MKRVISAMFRILRSVFGRGRGIELSQTSYTYYSKALIAVAPSYDRLTTTMAVWLGDFLDELDAKPIRRLFGADASFEMLSKAIAEYKDRGQIILFFGHGTSDAFLTSCGLGCDDIVVDGNHTRLCRADHLDLAAGIHAIAYCCFSGLRFGPAFVCQHNTKAFIGFDNELPFLLGKKHREDSFRRPMLAAVRHAAETEGVSNETEEVLKQAYKEERRMWLNDPPEFDKAMLMAMFLREHLEGISLHS